jgi:hypothetical protein
MASNPFEERRFRLAMQLGVPIPCRLPGQFDSPFAHWKNGFCAPATIAVWMHDTIETEGMKKRRCQALKERVPTRD